MRQRENDIDSDEGLSELLRESLAVDASSEARVLAGVSANIQNISVPKMVPARSARGVWQHALKTAVVIALTIGLFAMVSQQKPQTVKHGISVAEEGTETPKEKRPKPDDNAPAPGRRAAVDPYAVLVSYYEGSNRTEQALNYLRRAQDEENVPGAVQTERDRIASSIDIESELFSREYSDERILSPSAKILRTELIAVDPRRCMEELWEVYCSVKDGANPQVSHNPDYIIVPGVEHDGSSGKVLAFCRCGNHPDRHVLMANGKIKTVESNEALQKLFAITANEIHLDMSSACKSRQEVENLILDLGDEDFKVRESATEALMNTRGRLLRLIKAGAKSDDAERATRCIKILKVCNERADLRRELGLNE
jgi:hypothetical protein